MKINCLPLALAATLLSSVSPIVGADGQGSSVGDLPGFGEDAYFADEPSFAAQPGLADAQGEVARLDEASPRDIAGPNTGDDALVGPAGLGDPGASDAFGVVAQTSIVEAPERRPRRESSPRSRPRYAPIGADALQPVGHHETYVGSHHVGDLGMVPPCEGCDRGCDGCCDRGHVGLEGLRKCRIGRVIDCDTWMTAEALLWFPQARSLPVLVASTTAGDLPTLAPGGVVPPGVTNQFGGEINGGLSGGFRIDYGRWIHQDFGIGGRFWILGENGESFSANGVDGSDSSLGIPFFETNPASPGGIGENAVLIGFDDGNNVITGSVAATSSLEMLAAETYGRIRLGCATDHQLDLIGGYSYFQIDDSLRLGVQNLNTANDTERSFYDSFDAENRFHGGQVGFELSTCRGRWMARSLTKVHLGNMQQTYIIDGSSTSQITGGPLDQFEGGIFTQPQQPDGTGNIGTFERDEFAFAPELNFKLAYRFRPNVLLSVGYSFLYFDNVALNGAVIDRAVNGPNLASGVYDNATGFNFDDSSLWVQGIDIGAVIDF